MRKAYVVLQKKLKELEAELNVVLSLPAETPCHELLSEGIDRRLLFLRNLLSAEIESHPYSKPQHLHHIDLRLTRLETIFRDWDTIKTTATSSSPTSQIDDNASMCSCTKTTSYLDEEDQFFGSSDIGSPVYEDEPEIISEEQVQVEEKMVPPTPQPLVFNEAQGEKKGDERRRVWICKSASRLVIFALVICLGALMATSFSEFPFYYYKEKKMEGFFLTPT
ncbi:hypothetical protein BVC80_8145g2 [Macleaya cordata]|uniref:DUF7610 domain-containing protein n=1 Tax=Macleaya cordata TaxID=56857 RepID=A0A200R052_MACCD|nr:hypothetical protein BVC80_8145g2 [Macleaya cordata]